MDRFRGRAQPRVGGCCSRLWRSCSAMMRILFTLLLATIFILGTQLGSIKQLGQWYILFWYGLFILFVSQWASVPGQFFRGEGPFLWGSIKKLLCAIEDVDDEGIDVAEDETAKPVSFWILAPSVFISWLFSKNLRDAAYLAGQYGVFGAVACSGWFTSYITAALVGYILRTRYKFHSLSTAIGTTFGNAAVWSFSFALIYRLINDLWRNVAVIASFFDILDGNDPLSSKQNFGWWVCLISVVLITLIVSVIGGLRASLSNSRFLAAIAIAFLGWLLYIIHKSFPGGLSVALNYNTSYTINNAGDLWMTTLLQGMFSYPFHDPILTDRSFLGRPRTMLFSFFTAAILAVFFLVAFSLIGVWGMSLNDPINCLASNVLDGTCGEPVVIATTFVYNNQPVLLLSVVTILLLSTTIASMTAAFVATAKVVVLELGGFTTYFRTNGDKGPLSPRDPQLDSGHVWSSRVVMMIVALLAILPFAGGVLALDNSIITGTIVIGLGPPIFLLLFWRNDWHPSPLSFHFPFWGGVVIGIVFQANVCPVNGTCGGAYQLQWFDRTFWALGTGTYRHLLGVNFWSLLICISLTVLGFLIDQIVLKRGGKSANKQYVSGWIVLAGGVSVWIMVVMAGLVVSYWQAQAVGVLVAMSVGLLAVASVMCLGMSFAFAGPEQQMGHEAKNYQMEREWLDREMQSSKNLIVHDNDSRIGSPGVEMGIMSEKGHRRNLTGDSIGEVPIGKMHYDLSALEPDMKGDEDGHFNMLESQANGYKPPDQVVRIEEEEIIEDPAKDYVNSRQKQVSKDSIPPLEHSSEQNSPFQPRRPDKSNISTPVSRKKDSLGEPGSRRKNKGNSPRRDREIEEERGEVEVGEFDEHHNQHNYERKSLVIHEDPEMDRNLEASGADFVKVHRSPPSPRQDPPISPRWNNKNY